MDEEYLRKQAELYRQLAGQTGDIELKEELFGLAAVCEEAANRIDDRLTSG